MTGKRSARDGHDCPGGGDSVFVGVPDEHEVPTRTRCTVCDRDDVLVLGTYVGTNLAPSGYYFKLRAHKAKVRGAARTSFNES